MTSATRHIELHYAGDFDAGQELLNIGLWATAPSYECTACRIHLHPNEPGPIFTPFAAVLDDAARWVVCQKCVSTILL